MKKTTISVSYDEERLNTLKVYLSDRGMTVEEELAKNLDAMYVKFVPAQVRDFFAKRSGGAVEKPAPKGKKPKLPDTAVNEDKEDTDNA